jgi:hypothetical protein
MPEAVGTHTLAHWNLEPQKYVLWTISW